MAANRRYYIDGSTVRKIEDMPEKQVRRTSDEVRGNTVRKASALPAEPERRKPVRKARPKTRKKRSRLFRRNQDVSFRRELGYSVFSLVIVGLMVLAGYNYLSLAADVRADKSEISALQKELTNQKNANSEYKSRLEASVDLDEIYKIATQELGMVYSKPGQTVYYSKNSEDYVVQYKDIPETK